MILVNPHRGSTLLIALWALLLLSAVVFGWARWIDRRFEEHREETLGLEARSLALSGLTVALHPQLQPGSELLMQDFGNERSYEVKITGEGGKINLPYFLQEGDPSRREFLHNYLMRFGLTLEERDAFVDGILDWIDPDNLRRNRGRETSPDYQPTNRPLSSLEELPLIHGTAPLIAAHPDWRDDFTLYSTGPLDLKYAPAELIALLPGLNERQVDAYVTFRRGSDGIDGTPDDPEIQDISAAAVQLGLNSDHLQQIGALVSYDDPTIHVRSMGHAGNVHRQIDVIARKLNPTTPPTILIRIEP